MALSCLIIKQKIQYFSISALKSFEKVSFQSDLLVLIHSLKGILHPQAIKHEVI